MWTTVLSFLRGAEKVIINKLQRVMNAAARVILTGTRKFDRGMTQLTHDNLHWLDVPKGIEIPAETLYMSTSGPQRRLFRYLQNTIFSPFLLHTTGVVVNGTTDLVYRLTDNFCFISATILVNKDEYIKYDRRILFTVMDRKEGCRSVARRPIGLLMLVIRRRIRCYVLSCVVYKLT